MNYDQYLTFIRKQGPGGCFIYATLTIMDILKKRDSDCMLTPNLSYRFAEFFYNSDYLYNPATGNYDIPKPFKKHDHFEVLKNIGCCPETSMPSNYDGFTPVPNKKQIDEALLYKIKNWGSPQKPKKDQPDPNFRRIIKGYLNTYGPVYARIWPDQHKTDGSIVEDHIVAITGYDDLKGVFEYVNSRGDTFEKNGKGLIPYTNFLDTSPYPQTKSLFPQIIEVQYIENDNNPISNMQLLKQPMARIQIKTTSADTMPGKKSISYGRNVLVLRLGVANEKTLLVWDRNNSYISEGTGLVTKFFDHTFNQAQILDDSKELCLDFPLPEYWVRHWPPSTINNWYLEVENHSIPGTSDFFPCVTAKVVGFMITLGKVGSPFYISSPLVTTISPGQTSRVEIKS